MTQPVTPDAIMQLGMGFWGSKALLSAVELGLFAALSETGPLHAEALRKRLGLHRRGELQPLFDAYVTRHGLSDRLSFTAGDFFTDQLPSADVLIMGPILHDWNLDQKRMLVQKAYDALPDGGALIVYDAIIDDDRRTHALWSAGKSEHADRDNRGIRLHR